MQCEDVISKIKPHESALKRAGLLSLYVFGSTARQQATTGSDVDLLFEVAPATSFNLLDQAKLQTMLCDMLNAPVDLIERASLRPQMRARLEQDQVRIF
jgi:uncharacterized protein